MLYEVITVGLDRLPDAADGFLELGVIVGLEVCFQMQEVAMVIASDRYLAADAADMVEVEYEELPAIVDPHKRNNFV